MLPLTGLRVLDLSRVLAAPVCTQLLGALGATVWKVEHPQRGDETRKWAPPALADGTSTYFLSCNMNKKSVAVDFSNPRGGQAVRSLARHCDVLVENFRPNALAKYGLGQQQVAEVNPKCIYASLSAFGQSGVRKNQPGYDVAVAAIGGLLSITGSEGPEGKPCKPGVALTDQITGLYLAIGILSSLLQRQSLQQGQNDPSAAALAVSTSLFEAQIASLANVATAALNAGMDGARWGTSHPSIVPYRAYPTGDGGHLLLAVTNDQQFVRLAHAVNRPEWASDARLTTNSGRVQHREEIDAALENVFSSASRSEWLQTLSDHDLTATPINTALQALEDPQTSDLGLVQEIQPHSSSAEPPALEKSAYRVVRPPLTLRDGSTGDPLKLAQTPAPYLGEHTATILQDYAGFSMESIEEGVKEGWLYVYQ